MFGAIQHHTVVKTNDWEALENFRRELTAQLRTQGRTPHSIPIGGSTPVGALGYHRAYGELMQQCVALGFTPDVIVHTSSSGGTHAGLVAGLVEARANGTPHCPVIAIGVAKGVALHTESIRQLSDNTLHLLGLSHQTLMQDVVIDKRFLGQDYAVPTQGATDAAHWAAHRGAWILDPVYTAKGFSGLLGIDAEGGFQGFRNVVFIHTGGLPSVFATNSH